MSQYLIMVKNISSDSVDAPNTVTKPRQFVYETINIQDFITMI